MNLLIFTYSYLHFYSMKVKDSRTGSRMHEYLEFWIHAQYCLYCSFGVGGYLLTLCLTAELIPTVSQKRFKSPDCDIIYTIYQYLCTQIADPKPFRGTFYSWSHAL